MDTPNAVAAHVETAITNYVERYRPEVELTRFTPSIVMGRRYIGMEANGHTYMVEVNVTEV